MKLARIVIMTVICILNALVGAAEVNLEFQYAKDDVVRLSKAKTPLSTGMVESSFFCKCNNCGSTSYDDPGPLKYIAFYSHLNEQVIPIDKVQSIAFFGIREGEDMLPVNNKAIAVTITLTDGKEMDGYTGSFRIYGENEFGSTVIYNSTDKKGLPSKILVYNGPFPTPVKGGERAYYKKCPRCGTTFDKFDYRYCPYDGTPLEKITK